MDFGFAALKGWDCPSVERKREKKRERTSLVHYPL